MVFFDFGLFKRMPPGAVELEIGVARAIIEGDVDTIMRLGAEVGFFPEPDKFDPQRVLAHFRAATSWYTIDQYTELTPDYATQVLIDMSDPRSEYFGQLRHESAPRITSSAGGWRCSRSRCSRNCMREGTSTGSRGSGSTTTRPPPSSASSRPSSTAARSPDLCG